MKISAYPQKSPPGLSDQLITVDMETNPISSKRGTIQDLIELGWTIPVTLTKKLTINADNSGSAGTLLINDTVTNPGFTFNGDTGLFRSGVGQLQTQGLIWSIRATSGVEAISASTSGDTVRRIAMYTDGSLRLSSGSAASDSRMTHNSGGGFQFNNTTGTSGTPGNPVIKIQPTGVMSGSASTGGALLIDMQSQVGSGLSIYSAGGAGQLGRLVNITVTNSAYDAGGLRVDYAGTSHAVSISSTSTGANAQALNVVSTNINDTAVGIQGSETSRGTVKIIHLYGGGAADSSSSALSLRANGTGTAAQGIFFDAEDSGTTGALIKMRNAGVDKFVVGSGGSITTGIWAGTTVGVSAGGTGQTSYTDGQLLIGNSSGNTLTKATLTGTSNRLTVTNGGGSITLDISSSYVGQSSITTLGTIGTGVWQGTAVGIAYGGTGQATAAAGFNALSPMTTAGDIIYGGASGAGTRLAAGTTSQVLIGGTTPSWGAVALASMVSGTLPIGNGGTGQTTATAAFDALSPNTTLGDMAYRGAANNVRLAGNITATKKFLVQTGTGAVSAAPAWDTILAADLPTGTTATQGALRLDSAVPAAPSSTFIGAAGAVGKASDSGHIHERYEFNPVDANVLAWAYDPVMAPNSTALATAGTVYVIKIHCPVAISVTNIIMQVVTQGSSLTSGQCFAALYQSGSLLGTTADQATAWGTTGGKTMAISGGAVNVAAGDVYVAVFFNGTTGPAFSRAANISGINGALAAASSRFGTADTGRTTTMPGTLGTVAALSVSYWAALS